MKLVSKVFSESVIRIILKPVGKIFIDTIKFLKGLVRKVKYYKVLENVKRAYVKNAGSELKDFKVNFIEQKARYIKVVATSLKQTIAGGGVWLFVDEILIN